MVRMNEQFNSAKRHFSQEKPYFKGFSLWQYRNVSKSLVLFIKNDLKLLKLHFGCYRRYVHMSSLFERENYDQCALIFQVSVHDLPIVMIRGYVADRAVAYPEDPPLLDWI